MLKYINNHKDKNTIYFYILLLVSKNIENKGYPWV
jgi:hypothetical protein